ncbi:hypothetical protein TNCV_3350551 [Trichonephila clavipes]|nr:hypothetical protein TNCV_3350551 [Trichonephila clavipes]
MSYDYVACKRSPECLFGLGALGKVKFQRTVFHCQSAGIGRVDSEERVSPTEGIPKFPRWDYGGIKTLTVCKVKNYFEGNGQHCGTPRPWGIISSSTRPRFVGIND